MNSIARRRRSLMGKKGNVVFEWDYTEGISDKFVTGAHIEMTTNGLLVKAESGANMITRNYLATNIPLLSKSCRTTIEYADITCESGRYSNVGFSAYSDAINQHYLRISNLSGSLKLYNNSTTSTPQGPIDATGTIVIEYDVSTNTLSCIQGEHYWQGIVAPKENPSTELNLIAVEKNRGTIGSSVVVKHVKIEEV